MGLEHPQKLLGGGYFACTAGGTTSAILERYLDDQSAHHGYADRQDPPVWLQTWPTRAMDLNVLQASHSALESAGILCCRPGTGSACSRPAHAEAVGDALESGGWRATRSITQSFMGPGSRAFGLASHPSVVPLQLVLALLNESQTLMASQFSSLLLHADSRRLWKPGAYVGTYGDLATPHIQAYLGNWRASNELR